jgi:hypothetical protein
MDVGVSGRSWKYHTDLKGGEIYWYINSRKIAVDTAGVKGDFVSFKVVNSRPEAGYWTDWVIDVFDPTRYWWTENFSTDYGYNDYRQTTFRLGSRDSYSERDNIGLAVRMEQYGNDIVIPNGRGETYGYDIQFDYAYTFVTVQNGVDSVVGGFGMDVILSESLDYSRALEKFQNKFNIDENNLEGSKFFVGGSDDDFLSGGRDSDLLVGDRFNNYELYLNREALSQNVPTLFEDNKKRLLSYQPPDFNNGSVSRTFDRGLGKSISHIDDDDAAYRLLRPGNDVIHGNGGADIIYGDGNIDDINELYHFKAEYTQSTYLAAPSNKRDWSKLHIGADFIDGGSGNDEIHAGYGSDAIIGGQGSDIIYIGDQIIAPDYQPLWGPKVVWGSAYNDLQDVSPDLFVLGDLYTQEIQIKSKEAARYDEEQKQKDAIASKWTDFLVDIASQAASEITGGLSDLAISIFSLFASNQTTADKIVEKPKNADGLTLIRDFGGRDLLAVKIRYDELLLASSNASAEAPVNPANYPFNSLIGTGAQGQGYVFTYSPTAGESYTRMILEGYTGKLYEIKRVADPLTAPDGVYLLLGADGYAMDGYKIWNPGG